MTVSRPPQPRKRKRGRLRFLFLFAATTAMIATGGFGAFPDNPLTQSLQGVIGENFSTDYLNPFNAYMENIAAPTIQPQPDSVSTDESVLDPLAWLEGLIAGDPSLPAAPAPQETEELVNIETAVALMEGTQTQIALTQNAFTLTSASIQTQTQMQTSTPTLTSIHTATQSITPTWTVQPVIIYPTDTKMPPPAPTSTATATATASPTCSQNLGGNVSITFKNFSTTESITRYWVDFSCNLVSPEVMTPGQVSGPWTTTIGHSYRFVNTTTGELVADHVVTNNNYTVDASTGTAYPPAGFTLSNISLNTLTNGGAIFVFPSNTFTVNFNYSVWASANCPGCIIQLVAGMGSAGVGTTNCAYNGVPGISPGASGATSLTLTAPATPGVYDIVVQHHAQLNCADAIAAYTGAAGVYQTIGQIVVNGALIDVFNGGTYSGNLGGRAGADALCSAAKPGAIGNTNVRALISIVNGDAIADMPANYGVNTNIPIVYFGGQLIASNWSDLLDGSINAPLTSSGVPSGGWWSGSESDAGNALVTTPNCNGFTVSNPAIFGNVGNNGGSGSGWMSTGASQDCSSSQTLICIADP